MNTDIIIKEIHIMFSELKTLIKSLEICEYEDYYGLETSSFMWILNSNERGIRVFASENYGLSIEFGEKTFGRKRFLEKAKELKLSDSIFDAYDQLYPPQKTFEYFIENSDINILKNIVIESFEMD